MGVFLYATSLLIRVRENKSYVKSDYLKEYDEWIEAEQKK
jgi:hypothetical protein